MMRGGTRRIGAAVIGTLVIAMAGTGCQKKTAEPALTPEVAPPIIKEAGVLSVAVDPAQPPFAGRVDGQVVGFDVDVAAAVAERLGLKLKLVQVSWNDTAKAVADRTVDLGLAAIPITDAVLADVSVAGSYATDGLGLFAKVATGTTEGTAAAAYADPAALISDARVACQAGTSAQWHLEHEYWEGFAKTYDTLRQAFDALAAGEADLVACDAFVGAYLARDYQDIRFVAPLREATPLGVLVAKDSVELEAKIREVLDGMAADGTLAAIRQKWVGDLPELSVAASTATTDVAP